MELSNQQFGKYLKDIREQLGYSTRDVSKLCDISQSYLSLVENGKRKPSAIILKKLSSVYYIDYIDLYEKAGYIDLAEAEKVKNKTNNNSSSSPAIVFVYGSIPAGIPMEMIEDVIDTEEIPSDWLKGDKQYFGLKVHGNSMMPKYQNNDTIICLKCEDCESGDDCVVAVNGDDATFKKVIKNENGIILQPLNPEFSPLVYTNEDIKKLPVRILGKVVELRRKI